MYSLTLLTLLPLTAALNSSSASCPPLPSPIVFSNQVFHLDVLRPFPFFNQTLTSHSVEKGFQKARRVVPVDERHLAPFSAIRAPSRKYLAVPPKKTHTIRFPKEVPLLAILYFVTMYIISVCLFCTLIQVWELECSMEEPEETEVMETLEEKDEVEEEWEEEEWEEAEESEC